MVLLDELLFCEGERLRAKATVRPGPYSDADGSLPSWLGIEILAQGVAAWVGWEAWQAGREVQLGFLLGTRRYECELERLPAGMVLIVDVERSMQDGNGMGVFECSLFDGAIDGASAIARARLNLYQPNDVVDYTQEPPPQESISA
jgi:predicted hotdog family 3-hydroxylacyl-ACP dehydratase